MTALGPLVGGQMDQPLYWVTHPPGLPCWPLAGGEVHGGGEPQGLFCHKRSKAVDATSCP